MTMTLFDCNAAYGIFSVPPTRRADTPDDLLQEMASCGISAALVRHAAQIDESPQVGNRVLCEQIRCHDDLAPSWAILPPDTGELGDVAHFLADMRVEGVRALWAYPSKHRYLLNATTFGDLFDELVARRIPLMLPRQEQSGGHDAWQVADELLSEFPDMRLAVVGHGPWGDDRYFRPMLRRYRHFYVDTSRYELDGGIAQVCQLYGPERLLFGTAFPHTGMGGAMLTLLQCDMPDGHKRLVAGENLKRLLEEADLS